jgi:hypothetical protein
MLAKVLEDNDDGNDDDCGHRMDGGHVVTMEMVSRPVGAIPLVAEANLAKLTQSNKTCDFVVCCFESIVLRWYLFIYNQHQEHTCLFIELNSYERIILIRP